MLTPFTGESSDAARPRHQTEGLSGRCHGAAMLCDLYLISCSRWSKSARSLSSAKERLGSNLPQNGFARGSLCARVYSVKLRQEDIYEKLAEGDCAEGQCRSGCNAVFLMGAQVALVRTKKMHSHIFHPSFAASRSLARRPEPGFSPGSSGIPVLSEPSPCILLNRSRRIFASPQMIMYANARVKYTRSPRKATY